MRSIGQDSRLHFSRRERETRRAGLAGTGGPGCGGQGGWRARWAEALRGPQEGRGEAGKVDRERGGLRPESPGWACTPPLLQRPRSLPPSLVRPCAGVVAERAVRGACVLALVPLPAPETAALGRVLPVLGPRRPHLQFGDGN